jgi:hypothetical protein
MKDKKETKMRQILNVQLLYNSAQRHFMTLAVQNTRA